VKCWLILGTIDIDSNSRIIVSLKVGVIKDDLKNDPKKRLTAEIDFEGFLKKKISIVHLSVLLLFLILLFLTFI